MTTYSNVAKPTTTTYTNTNAYLPSYDEPSLSYDDSTMYYDGINQSQYTNVGKPSSTPYTNVTKPT